MYDRKVATLIALFLLLSWTFLLDAERICSGSAKPLDSEIRQCVETTGDDHLLPLPDTVCATVLPAPATDSGDATTLSHASSMSIEPLQKLQQRSPHESPCQAQEKLLCIQLCSYVGSNRAITPLMNRQTPRLKNGVDLQLQSAFQDSNWPVVIRLAEKRARTLNDQYYEVRHRARLAF